MGRNIVFCPLRGNVRLTKRPLKQESTVCHYECIRKKEGGGGGSQVPGCMYARGGEAFRCVQSAKWGVGLGSRKIGEMRVCNECKAPKFEISHFELLA